MYTHINITNLLVYSLSFPLWCYSMRQEYLFLAICSNVSHRVVDAHKVFNE